jgi:hypothetical protein
VHRRRLIFLALIPIVILGAAAAFWIHDAFGINVPWDTPDFFSLCGRRYDQGGALRNPDATYTFWIRTTVFDLPIPMPEVSPIPGVADWGGCPLQVVLKRKDGDIVYAFIQGGP